jgi:hypothetical protein
MSRWTDIAGRALPSLILAIVCFIVGPAFMTGLTPSKKKVVYGPDGPITRLKTEEEKRADERRVFRANWPAYAFIWAGLAFSALTLFSIARGTVVLIRTKGQAGVPGYRGL